MLVLTRSRGQSIVIGDTVEVTVTFVDEHHVQLGINAPREIDIQRKELVRPQAHGGPDSADAGPPTPPNVPVPPAP